MRPRSDADNTSIVSDAAPSYRSYDTSGLREEEEEWTSDTTSEAPTYYSGSRRTFVRDTIHESPSESVSPNIVPEEPSTASAIRYCE